MRALWRDEKLLLLDEPTSMLTPQGVADLGRMMRRLREKGVALILITHKLLEAYEFGDRISVLRLGRFAGEIGPQRLQAMSEAERTETVIAMMFGTDGAPPLAPPLPPPPPPLAPPPLPPRIGSSDEELAILLGEQAAPRQYGGAQRAGDAVGARPVDGARFCRDAAAGGELRILGGRGARNRRRGRQRPEAPRRSARRPAPVAAGTDRARRLRTSRGGACRSGGGAASATSPTTGSARAPSAPSPWRPTWCSRRSAPRRFWRRGISDWELIHAQRPRADRRRNDIRTPSELTPVGKLSGGNVQKVLLARELDAEANVAILNKPTYGLDLHNQRLALDRIVAAAARGVALIVISTDLDELLEVSDRIGVMFQGRLAGIVDNDEEAGDKIRRLMTGAAAP